VVVGSVPAGTSDLDQAVQEDHPVLTPDSGKAHTARVYDWYLDGKTHYAVDTEVGRQVLSVFPNARKLARNQRDFMERSIRFLAGQGVRQYLDIGTGIPTEPNLHQLAQALDPTAVVVYVDNDPIVHTYAQHLLTSTPEGRTEFLLADALDPEAIHGASQTAALDLTRPVALCLLGLTQFLPADTDTPALVRRLLEPLPSGSWLAYSTLTDEFDPGQWTELRQVYRQGGMSFRTYTRDEVAAVFDGLELVDPGIIPANRWRPEIHPLTNPGITDTEAAMYAAVARKP
jgi:S-adenosyl methyltransferase